MRLTVNQLATGARSRSTRKRAETPSVPRTKSGENCGEARSQPIGTKVASHASFVRAPRFQRQIASQKARRGPLKVVLVYDGFADLIRAHEIWSRLVSTFEGDIEFVSSAWNFSLLRDPELGRRAARKAAGASMLLFAASGRSELPTHMRDWIGASIPWRKGRQSALVAVLDDQSPPSKTGAQICKYLRATAQKTGMDFFCNTERTRFVNP